MARRRRRAIAVVAIAGFAVAAAAFAFLGPNPPTGSSIASHTQSTHPSPISSCGPSARIGFIREPAMSVVVEQYGGLNDQPPASLRASILVSDPAQTNQLIDLLNALPPYPCGPIFCGVDDGSYFELLFSFSDGTRTAVRIDAQGCEGVVLGGSKQPVAWAFETPALLGTLTALVTAKGA